MASLKLFMYHLKEEYRAQSSMFKSSFLAYPFLMLLIALVMGLLLVPMLRSLTVQEAVIVAHLGVFMTGMLVGGFAMFQDQVLERRVGGIRLLLNSPSTLPISYKEAFAYFYFKDLLYYIIMNVLPLVIGLWLSTLATGLHVNILLAILTFIVAFLCGVSTSFALSTVLVINRALFAVVLVVIAVPAAMLVAGPDGALAGIGALMPFAGAYLDGSPAGLLIPLLIFLTLSAFSLLFIRETPRGIERRYKPRFTHIKDRLSPLRDYASLAAKEWLDLTRSGGLNYILFSFMLPLLFLWALLWMLSSVMDFLTGGIGFEFNLLFYAAIIGFFSTEVYGWLNNMDTPESFRTIPVSLPMLIKSKLILFFALNACVSTAYLVFICLTRNELVLLPAALYTMIMVSSFVGVFTAYMTGIFTNSLMFDYKVILVYFFTVTPALIVLIVASFFPSFLWYGLGFATLLGFISLFLAGRIDKKWGRPDIRV